MSIRENWCRRVLVREVTKNPAFALIEIVCGDGGNFQKVNYYGSTPSIWAFQQSGQVETCDQRSICNLQKGLSDCEKQDCLTSVPKVIGRKSCNTYHLLRIIPTVKHGGGNIMLLGVFFSRGTSQGIRKVEHSKPQRYP